MKTGTLQSLWRGFGHSFVLMSTLALIGFLCFLIFAESHSGGWNVFMYEVAEHVWRIRLLLAAFTINFAILSVCCYRKAQNRPIIRLFGSYLLVAMLFCLTYAYAKIAVGGIGDIPVDPKPRDRYGSHIIAVNGGRPPRLSKLLEPIPFFAMPLAPLLILQALSISKKNHRVDLNSDNS